MSNVTSNLIGVKVVLKNASASGKSFDGAGRPGTIAAVYCTGSGLYMLVALDADTSYRDAPKGQQLVEVYWSWIDKVTY